MISLQKAISIANDTIEFNNIVLDDICGEYSDKYVFYCKEINSPENEVLNYCIIVSKIDGKVTNKNAIDISLEDAENNIKPKEINIKTRA